jgi:ISXO2 transposase-like protein/transposase-like zinc ribbon protein
MAQEPKTLQQAIIYFSNPDNCVSYLVDRRWPDGVVCPTCGRMDAAYVPARRVWQCKTRHPKSQFSAKVGTVMEDSAIGLDKWLVAMWLVANSKNGVSSWEVHRSLGITQKTAWFLLHRIRLAMGQEHTEKMGGDDGGPCEADETYVGGAPKNKHGHNPKAHAKYIRDENSKWNLNPNYAPQSGRATKKVPVMGILDRELRQVRAKVIPNVDRGILQEAILANVNQGSKVFTDSLPAYKSLHKLDFIHEAVNHVDEYVRGEVHTNGLENFWSCLKRGLKGTYIAVEPFHLDRYVTEQVWRYNNRATKDNPLTDADRFAFAVTQIVGKRLTYAELTGKVNQAPL